MCIPARPGARGANTPYTSATTNVAAGNYSVISGGVNNTATGIYGAVGGGFSNANQGYAAVIAGGYSNATGNGYAAILGGFYNTLVEFSIGHSQNSKKAVAFVTAFGMLNGHAPARSAP